MNINGTTAYAEGSLGQAAVRGARKLGDERGAAPRKHFLDAYAEHLQALKRDRGTK
jgi:hypothetical protein